MKEEYVTRYVIKDGKMKKVRISRKEAMKDVDEVLREDKVFLEIMAKM